MSTFGLTPWSGRAYSACSAYLAYLACALLVAACGGAVGARQPQAPTPGAGVTDADASGRKLAPDWFARAQRAQDQAARATNPDSAREHGQRAQLLLSAARLEAERIELERASSRFQQQAARALELRGQLRTERRALEAELQTRKAAERARALAVAAFALGHETGTPAGSTRQAEREQARSFFLERTRLTLSAALALGQSSQATDAAQAQISHAQAMPAGAAASLRAAQRVHAVALRALGAARARQPQPDPATARDLAARARERGLAIELGTRGAVLELTSLFANGSAQLSGASRRRLEGLRDLLHAFPHGALRVEAQVARADAGLSSARAARIRQVLAVQLGAARLAVALEHATAPAGQVILVLPAYAMP